VWIGEIESSSFFGSGEAEDYLSAVLQWEQGPRLPPGQLIKDNQWEAEKDVVHEWYCLIFPFLLRLGS